MWLETCYEHGILSERQIELPMNRLGSLEFLEALFNKISRREGFGEILAEGLPRAAKQVGSASEGIANAQHMFPYGPKVFAQSALLYAIEERPPITELHEVCAAPTKWALWYTTKGEKSYVSTEVLRKIGKKFWGSEQAVDFSTHEGKALAAIKIQHRAYAKESLILCDFVWPIFDDASSADHVGDSTLDSQLLSAVIGKEIETSELEHIAERIFNLNRALVLTEWKKGREDDRLPESLFIEREEPIMDVFGMHNPDLLLPGAGNEIISRKGKAVEKNNFELMLDEYYELRGWDKTTGLLKKEKLKELDLSEVIEHLSKKIL
jgi:aldehyde:ferredoxin oxidoreductase